MLVLVVVFGTVETYQLWSTRVVLYLGTLYLNNYFGVASFD